MTRDEFLKIFRDIPRSKKDETVILSDDFIEAHTEFYTLDGFCFGLPRPDVCDTETLDRHVMAHSRFPSWERFVVEAKRFYEQNSQSADGAYS